MGPGDWVQVCIAVVTFLAVLVALFQEKIKDGFNKAHLSVAIKLFPPHSHKIQLTTYSAEGRIVDRQDVIYVRIKIRHTDGDAARNVEVMMVKLWEYVGQHKRLMRNFIPLNLTWANQQDKRDAIKIPSGLFRYCDLGYLYKDNDRVLFHFDTIVNPNGIGDNAEIANVVGAGKYMLELWVCGDNTDVVKKKWDLVIDGKWSASQDEMLAQHIQIDEVKA